MNLVIVDTLSRRWYGLLRSATSNQTGSQRKFSSEPNTTSSRMRPKGVHERPGTMPWKVVRLGYNSLSLMPSLIIVLRYRMLMELSPSMRVLLNLHEYLGAATTASTTSA